MTPQALLRHLPPMLGAAAVACGVFGFLPPIDHPWALRDWHHAIVSTLQLFVLNVGADNLNNGWTMTAAMLAPLATAGAAMLALQGWLQDKLRRLGLRRGQGHFQLVLGGGHLAAAIFAQRTSTKDAALVVGVDAEASPPLENILASQREQGQPGYLVQGDAQSLDLLRSLNASAASKVWVLTGDDLTNLDITRRLLSLRASSQNQHSQAQHIITSVHHAPLVRAQQQLWPPPQPDTTVHYIDVARLAARQLLMTYPPAYPHQGSGKRLHLCVLGHSELSLALLAHAAAHCVYAEDPAQALHITLVSPQASATRAQLFSRHPVLDPQHAHSPELAALLPLATIHTLDADPATLMPSQWQALQHSAPFDMVYVSAEHDLLTYAAALRALALRDTTHMPPIGRAHIVACLNDRGAHTLGDAATWPSPLATFDIFEQCFGVDETYPSEHADRRAKLVHWAYGQENLDDLLASEAEAGQSWQDQTLLNDFGRWSSRMAADHIDVKLATLGLRVLPASAPATAMAFSPEALRETLNTHLTPLARLEHRRYLAERLLDGWLPLAEARKGPDHAPSARPYSDQKNQFHLNTTLLPFDELNNAPDREKDNQVIRVTVTCLSSTGAMVAHATLP